MTKRKQIVVASLIVTLAAMICVFVRSQEPVVRGKSLTAWLIRQSDNDLLNPGGASNETARNEAESAIREMGTNAIPALLKMAVRKDSLIKQKLLTVLPERIAIRLGLWADTDYEGLAEDGFRILGSLAEPAVPKLVALLSDGRPEVRDFAASALGSIGRGAQASIPSLLEHLYDQDFVVQRMVRKSLGLIRSEPDLVVPALIQSLQGTNKSAATAGYALDALVQYGEKAKTAVAVIVPLLSDNDAGIRHWATNALKAISPETH